jgi:hypothetical protein
LRSFSLSEADQAFLNWVCFHLIFFGSGWKFLPHSTLNGRNSLGRNDLAAAPRLASLTPGRCIASTFLMDFWPIARCRWQVVASRWPGTWLIRAWHVTEARKVESFDVQICKNAPRVIERT